MAKYTWDDLAISFDNNSGTPVDISAYVTAINGFKRNAPTVELTPAGAGDAVHLFGGLLTCDEVQITGPYDDAATTGPDALFIDLGCKSTSGGTRTLKLTYGSTKYSSVEVIITGYDRNPVKGNPNMYTVTLQPTGNVTEN
jgi:hypothetical protein